MAFFQGSLEEGIGIAVQQAKLVVCFVTDGEAESRLWEDDFFADEEIRLLLQSHCVALRLPAGSEREGYLTQMFPIPKKPTVIILKGPELREYIASGVAKDVWVGRMKAALTAGQNAPTEVATASDVSQSGSTARPAEPQNQERHADDSSASSSSGQATPPSPTGSRVQALLAERAAKLAEKKRKEEEEAKRRRAEKGKGKADAEAGGSTRPAEQSKHAEALRKRQREVREERERILKAIEDDKAARRARKAELEAERKAAPLPPEKRDSAPFAPASQLFPSSGRLGGEKCSIQVRLFDGSTIRSRFSSSETLKDVRRWVDDTPKDGKEPYTFKVLLTPLPSKTIDVTEEDQSLQALGLVPSSTLILLRVPKYAAAYSSSAAAGIAAQGNIFQRLVACILAIITGFFGTVSAFFSTLFSTGGPRATSEPASSRTSQSQAAADAARRRGGRIAGLDRTGDRLNDQQFYNGNSTNFEPRPDEREQLEE